MAVVALPYGSPSKRFVSLARLPITNAMIMGAEPGRDLVGSQLSDLTENDHLLMIVSSKALLARKHHLRCSLSLVLIEPPAIQRRYYRLLSLMGTQYRFIFTYSKSLRSRLSNTRYIAHGGLSVPVDQLTNNKLGGVSLLASAKRTTSGHRLRHQIASWAQSQSIGIKLLGRGYNPVDCVSQALVPYHFSVVIENSQCDGYFSEKLVDCMYCRTIPIYWGDPSIGNVFDSRGMICCSNSDEIITAIQSVNKSSYQQMLPFIESNFHRALEFRTSMVSRAATQLQKPI